MSFVTYNAMFNTWIDGDDAQLTDYEIQPDSGSANPWQAPANPGGNFTINIVRNPLDADANYLPMPLDTEGNFLAILHAMPSPSKNCAASTSNDCVQNVFGRPKDTVMNGMAPNRDSGYIVSYNHFGRGIVQVVQGKLPKVTQGVSPRPWLSSGNQLRHLSFCTYPFKKPYPLVACISNQNIKTDKDGYYTMVIGSPFDKPNNVNDQGDNWLPHSRNPRVDNFVVLRNMVQNEFAQSAQNVPADGSPLSAVDIMQEYYPQSKLCTVDSYQLKGRVCDPL